MRILNLAYPERSQIKFEVQKFPDGQRNVVIRGQPAEEGHTIVFDHVEIRSRLNNLEDLGLIICTVKSLRRLYVKDITLYVPYLLGARSDRQFEEGGNSYLVDVIAPILNSLELSCVKVLDVHSHVAAACINNLKCIDNSDLVVYALEQIFGDNWNNTTVMISPDAGASHKINKLAEKIGYKGDIITCSKERDNEGKLTKTTVPVTYSYSSSVKDYIIVDDICDGGATFINIAQELFMIMKGNFRGKLYLIVTHGVFSKDLVTLSDYFDSICCTNSYSDRIESHLNTYRGKQNFVRQLNVF